MLTATMRRQGDELHARLDGDLDAAAGDALARIVRELAVDPAACLDLDCAGLRAINSIGVMRWSQFREQLPPGLPLLARNCPVSFIDYANLMPAFIAPEQVLSLAVPLRCQCGYNGAPVVDTEQVLHLPQTLRCPRCRGEAEPELPLEDYLAFLVRG
jgi:hypothetical protein